jgi:hypothetical protein
MRVAIRPGKVTCAGFVAILMVLPNSIWKGSTAKGAAPQVRVVVREAKAIPSERVRVKFRKVPR